MFFAAWALCLSTVTAIKIKNVVEQTTSNQSSPRLYDIQRINDHTRSSGWFAPQSWIDHDVCEVAAARLLLPLETIPLTAITTTTARGDERRERATM